MLPGANRGTGAHDERSRTAMFFCVEQAHDSGCGVNSGPRRTQFASELPDCVCSRLGHRQMVR